MMPLRCSVEKQIWRMIEVVRWLSRLLMCFAPNRGKRRSCAAMFVTVKTAASSFLPCSRWLLRGFGCNHKYHVWYWSFKTREAHLRSAKIMALTPHALRVFGQIFLCKVTYFVRGDKLGSESSHAWFYPDCCDSHSCGAIENFVAFRGFWENIDREWSHRLLWVGCTAATVAAKWNQIKLKHNFCHRLHNEHSDSSIISGADNADSSFMIFMISYANRLQFDIST